MHRSLCVRRSVLALGLVVPLVGCGESAPGETPSPVTPSPATEPTPSLGAVVAPAPLYEVHEWGLVDVPLAMVPAELAAGPGREETLADSTMPPPSEPVPPPPPARPPHRPPVRPPVIVPPPVSVRKPVVYVHLAAGTTELRFDLDVHLPGGGSVIEHWPEGSGTGDLLRWAGVTASACTTPPAVPAFGRACDTADGYCERHDLPIYVADHVACLEVAGTRAPFLFYRGSSPLDALPLRYVAASRGAIEVTYTSAPPIARRVLRFARTPSGLRVAEAEIPLDGGTFSIPEPSAPADRSALEASAREDLLAHGLSAPEAEAFVRAWSGELFDTPAARAAPVVLDAYLLYWAPRDAVERMAELTFSPVPSAVHRALLARVELPR